MADCLLVTTSVNFRETADRLAQVLVKDRLAAIEAAFAHLHPYERPEITAVPLDGSAAYLRWIRDAVAPESMP